MVWFWQTRQRNSAAMRITRASRTGSATAGTASLAIAGPADHKAQLNSKHPKDQPSGRRGSGSAGPPAPPPWGGRQGRFGGGHFTH